jgi:hypothetical protein
VLSNVTYPIVKTTATAGGVIVDLTTAAMPTIQSLFTTAGEFVEGITHVGGGENRSCPSGVYPTRWIFTKDGAQKTAEAEQEHCSDFQWAFDLSLQRYADAVNALAISKRVFSSAKAVETTLTKQTGAAPSAWRGIFECLTQKTLIRDSNLWHTPRPLKTAPVYPDCKEAKVTIWGSSYPNVGNHPSSEIIKGCGERQAAPAGPESK